MGKNHSKPYGSLRGSLRGRKSMFLSRSSTIAPFTLHLDEPLSISEPSPVFRTSLDSNSSNDPVSNLSCNNTNGSGYIFPVNEKETGLMQARHYLYREIWGGNFASPVADILRGSKARVLDIGCGPGTWTCENACEFPNAKFYGVDIASIFPKDIKPINTEFISINILDGFPAIRDHTFDFVYVRNMMYAITIHDWPRVIKELVRILKPGGYIEIAENDLLWYNEGALTADLRNRAIECLRTKRSIEPIISRYLPDMMGATHQLPIVHREEKTVPVGSWGGNIGKLNFEVYKWGAENLAETVAPDLCLREAEYLDLLEDGFQEVDSGKVYQKHFRFWAKKMRAEDLAFSDF